MQNFIMKASRVLYGIWRESEGIERDFATSKYSIRTTRKEREAAIKRFNACTLEAQIWHKKKWRLTSKVML